MTTLNLYIKLSRNKDKKLTMIFCIFIESYKNESPK